MIMPINMNDWFLLPLRAATAADIKRPNNAHVEKNLLYFNDMVFLIGRKNYPHILFGAFLSLVSVFSLSDQWFAYFY